MTEPPISIVIASGAGGDFLFRCLASVVPEAQVLGAEVIVVDRVGEEVRGRIALEHPAVRILAPDLGHRPSVPELRAAGLDVARAKVVAVLEEHCTAPSGWLATIRDRFEPEDAAIGGPILDDGYRRLRDWVVYFSEYHNFLPPWPDGPRALLNGANIAYARAKVMAHRARLGEGYWEVVLHPHLEKDGRFRAIDAMGVHHTGPFDYGYYLRQRYLLSRGWGGTRRTQVSMGRRLIHLVAGPIFPLFLLARITRRVFASGRHRGRFLLAVPLLLPALVAYSWGEWLGYLAGPGRALEEVE